MPAPAELKTRAAAAVEAARPEILELSARIHANPEPAFEEVKAASVVCRGGRAGRVRGRAPRRAPRHGGAGPSDGREGSGRPADRGPRRVRRAAGSRARLRPQHDGGVGRRRGDRPGSPARRVRRRDRLPRHAGGGAGERQAVHARRRPAGRPRRGAALPPRRPRHGGLHAPRQRGRRRDVHGEGGPRGRRALGGEERARRGRPALPGDRAVAPAAAPARAGPRHRPRGRHGRQHHPGPGDGAVHDPQHRPGLLRVDARPDAGPRRGRRDDGGRCRSRPSSRAAPRR